MKPLVTAWLARSCHPIHIQLNAMWNMNLRESHRSPFQPDRASPLGWFLIACGFALSGCDLGSTAPLTVGDVAFDQALIEGLSMDHLAMLAGITLLQEAMATPEGLAEAGRVHEEVLLRQRQRERLREETILKAAGVTEADLEARYRNQPSWELDVRHLVLLAEPWQPASVRAAARQSAAQALAEIQRGDPFEAVVARWSEEPGAAARGGLLRPGREGTWVRPFWDAALALSEGEVSRVVETPFGFHVLRLDARRVLPFAEARSRVVREVAAQLGGGEAWEALQEQWISEIEIMDPDVAPRPAFDHIFDLLKMPPSEAVLAEWSDGALTHEAFVHFLLSHPGDLEDLERRLQTAAELTLLDTRATQAGIVVTPEEVAAEMQGWTQQALGWAAALGLQSGGTPEARATRALEALRRTGQNAGLARSQILEATPVLLAGGAAAVAWAP